MDRAGVEQAAAAFWKNDPYFPRPTKDSPEDQELWAIFKEKFLRTSGIILGSDSIAQVLMERIEAGACDDISLAVRDSTLCANSNGGRPEETRSEGNRSAGSGRRRIGHIDTTK